MIKREKMKVYVDMDGVLADFFAEITKISEYPVAHWKDLNQRGIEKALGEIHGTDFFRRLPMFPQTNTLLQSIINIAGSFSILSSPLTGDEDHCSDMKRVWLEENIKFDIDEIIITKNKHHWAEGNVLIDDYALNIYNWEKHGGYGIKYQANENNLSDVIIPLQALFTPIA